MSPFPFGEWVSLQYLPQVPGDVPEIGGEYATLPEVPGQPVQLRPISHGIQKWRITRNEGGDGHKIEGFVEQLEDISLPAWKNDGPEAGSRIRISSVVDASKYYVNDVDPYKGGWIISISPKDNYVLPGQSRFAGASGNDVEITGVPFYENPPPHPGWYALKL
ncbi:hypothetical protein RhiJN_23069 [Ceratobasidium sp. AG-Ba]|nr:hypothetical protein RhiJN_23069 [Ceratobasidium sp. AG-Ba]